MTDSLTDYSSFGPPPWTNEQDVKDNDSDDNMLNDNNQVGGWGFSLMATLLSFLTKPHRQVALRFLDSYPQSGCGAFCDQAGRRGILAIQPVRRSLHVSEPSEEQPRTNRLRRFPVHFQWAPV
jgi:hypothetical protein